MTAAPRPHRSEVLVCVLLALLVEAALRLRVPLPRLSRVLGCPLELRGGADHGPVRPLPHTAARSLAAVDLVLRRWPQDGTCLRGALVAGQRLRRLDPVLRLGVARVDGAVAAHAWLVVHGQELDPGEHAPLVDPRRP